MGFDFKFKKISIKQAFFIDEIFSSRVKVSKQKKNDLRFSKHFKIIKSANCVFDAIFLLQSFRNIGFPNGPSFRYGNFFIPMVEKTSKN